MEERGRGNKRRALVVYSRVGGGHRSAAEAVAAALKNESGGRVEPLLFDAYVEGGRFPLTRFPELYAWLARSGPRLWHMLFQVTNRPRGGPADAGQILEPLLRRGLTRTLLDVRPDLVASTLPVINGALTMLTRRHLPATPVEVVVTDWARLHGSWVAPGVSHYTVATREGREDLLAYGAPADRVDVVGIPVREPFTREPPTAEERAAVRSALGLDPGLFTILVMVGAEGSPRALGNVRALLGLPLADTQVVIVTGRSAALRQAMEAVPSRMPTAVLGFVDNVADLMGAADLLVTKAGGITLAEAFCAGPAILVHDLLPGQEEGNLQYALSQQAVRFAPTAASLAEQVAYLRSHPADGAALAARGRALGRPGAAADVARAMLARRAAHAAPPANATY